MCVCVCVCVCVCGRKEEEMRKKEEKRREEKSVFSEAVQRWKRRSKKEDSGQCAVRVHPMHCAIGERKRESEERGRVGLCVYACVCDCV